MLVHRGVIIIRAQLIAEAEDGACETGTFLIFEAQFDVSSTKNETQNLPLTDENNIRHAQSMKSGHNLNLYHPC